MYEKGMKYLADWRDRKGVRKRKSFATPEAAQAFEDSQKAIARPKDQGGAGQTSPKSSAQAGM